MVLTAPKRHLAKIASPYFGQINVPILVLIFVDSETGKRENYDIYLYAASHAKDWAKGYDISPYGRIDVPVLNRLARENRKGKLNLL